MKIISIPGYENIVQFFDDGPWVGPNGDAFNQADIDSGHMIDAALCELSKLQGLDKVEPKPQKPQAQQRPPWRPDSPPGARGGTIYKREEGDPDPPLIAFNEDEEWLKTQAMIAKMVGVEFDEWKDPDEAEVIDTSQRRAFGQWWERD